MRANIYWSLVKGAVFRTSTVFSRENQMNATEGDCSRYLTRSLRRSDAQDAIAGLLIAKNFDADPNVTDFVGRVIPLVLMDVSISGVDERFDIGESHRRCPVYAKKPGR